VKSSAFLTAILGDCRSGFGELRGPALGTDGRWGSRFYPLGDPRSLGAMASDAVELAEQGDIYVGAAPRKRRRGQAEDIEHGRLLAVDIDDLAAVDALGEFGLPPSLTVKTGSATEGVPHICAGWLLSRPATSQTITRLQRRLRDHLGGDAGYSASAATIIRIPETANWKHPEPRPVELADFDSDLRYSAEEIEDVLPMTPTRRPAPSVPKKGNPQNYIDAALAAVKRELGATGNRNDAVYRIGTRILWEGGLTEEDVLLVAPDLADLANEIAPKDHPYYVAEAEASIRSRYRRGSRREAQPALAEIDQAVANSKLTASQRAVMEALIGRAGRAGNLTITASMRQISEEGNRDRKTVERAIKALRKTGWIRKAGKGAKGASRFRLQPLSTPFSSARLGAGCPSLFSASHAVLGHGGLSRRTLSVLSSVEHPIGAVELAEIIGCHPKTARRHLYRLKDFGLAVELSPGRWRADLADVDAKLDRAASALGIAGRCEHRQRRHAVERTVYRRAQHRFAAEQEQRRAERLRRCRSGRRRRRIERTRLDVQLHERSQNREAQPRVNPTRQVAPLERSLRSPCPPSR
jgi:predicted transcriptional regulator